MENPFWKFLILVIIYLQVCKATCPEKCRCGLDNKGRKSIHCLQGDMLSIPVSDMNIDTEIIVISAPNEMLSNMLTIGPIFTQQKRFSELQEIHIVMSNVPTIGQYSFWGLQNLRILNLTHNNISSILEHNFRGLINLQNLYLDYNRIEEMPSETFHHLEDLKILSLSHNRISFLAPRLFRKLAKLMELDLSHNPLVELVPEVFKDIQDLKILKCRHCKLKMINTQLYHLLSGLIYLDLGKNDFKYVMADEFRSLKKLQILKYDGNHLPVVLENTFANQNNLHTLSLSRNRLAMVTTSAFTNLTILNSLDLSYNKLDRLEVQSFHPIADSLWKLDISGNHIGINVITYVLQILLHIRDLGMANLGLDDLPLGIFTNNQQLKSLDLSNNKFKVFPVQVLAPTPYLLELNLEGNKFQGLDEKILVRLEALPRVYLNKNPWKCDICHVNTMLTFMNKSYLNESLQDLICDSPKSLEGYRFSWLSLSDMDWCEDGGARFMQGEAGLLPQESRLSIIVAILLLLAIIVAALAAGICYSKRRAAQYYTNEDKRGPQSEKIFDNQLVIFGENDDLNFKFPVTDISEKPYSIIGSEHLLVSTINA